MIAGVFLAAGRGRRFGSDKLLYEIEGLPLVQHSLNACLGSNLSKIYAVLDPGSDSVSEIVRQSPDDLGKIAIVWNPHAERGMMSSVKSGLRSVDTRMQGAMIVLADMPFVTTELINLLVSRFEDTNGIVIPECAGVSYHPRVVPRRLFGEFLRLGDGDKGSKVIDRHRKEIVSLETGDRRTFLDIDTVEDLDSLG